MKLKKVNKPKDPNEDTSTPLGREKKSITEGGYGGRERGEHDQVLGEQDQSPHDQHKEWKQATSGGRR